MCSFMEPPQTSPCPATECGTFTPYAAHKKYCGANGGLREIIGRYLGEAAPASRLGRQVNGVAKRYAQSWNLHRLHPDPLLLAHTSITIHLPYGPYRGVKADVHSRPQGAQLTPFCWECSVYLAGNVPPSPLPCHFSVRGVGDCGRVQQ